MKYITLIVALLFSQLLFANTPYIIGNQLFMINNDGFRDNKKPGDWNFRNIENSFKKVSEKVYIAETETTNEQYNDFLNQLLADKNYDLLMQVKSEKTNWRSLLPSKYNTLTDAEIYANANPNNGNCPVQNLPYIGAVEYCKFLTDLYNNNTWKKKKFKRVTFRLPTEAEWKNAAHGGNNPSWDYPWGYEPRTPKGCFLSNYDCNNENCTECKISQKSASKDGGFFPVQADAYYPNAFGLYGIVGNVAEMVQEQGIAKGGSWQDEPSQCTILAQKKYTTPSPAIGFRVLMEVVERLAE